MAANDDRSLAQIIQDLERQRLAGLDCHQSGDERDSTSKSSSLERAEPASRQGFLRTDERTRARGETDDSDENASKSLEQNEDLREAYEEAAIESLAEQAEDAMDQEIDPFEDDPGGEDPAVPWDYDTDEDGDDSRADAGFDGGTEFQATAAPLRKLAKSAAGGDACGRQYDGKPMAEELTLPFRENTEGSARASVDEK